MLYICYIYIYMLYINNMLYMLYIYIYIYMLYIVKPNLFTCASEGHHLFPQPGERAQSPFRGGWDSLEPSSAISDA